MLSDMLIGILAEYDKKDVFSLARWVTVTSLSSDFSLVATVLTSCHGSISLLTLVLIELFSEYICKALKMCMLLGLRDPARLMLEDRFPVLAYDLLWHLLDLIFTGRIV